MKKLTFILLSVLLGSLSFSSGAFSLNSSAAATNATASKSASTVPNSHEDTIITESVKSQIGKSSTLSPLVVEVKTNKGVVIFTGMVDSDSQASSLVELAQSVIGVQDVDASNLKVKDSKHLMSDMWITAKVKGRLIREDIFGTKDIASINISVETKNGVVYLTGVVDNKDQIKNAIKLIQGMKGVKKVEYNVKKVTPAS